MPNLFDKCKVISLISSLKNKLSFQLKSWRCLFELSPQFAWKIWPETFSAVPTVTQVRSLIFFYLKSFVVFGSLIILFCGYDIVVYLCIKIYSMHRFFALPGWRHKCILRKERVRHFGLINIYSNRIMHAQTGKKVYIILFILVNLWKHYLR